MKRLVLVVVSTAALMVAGCAPSGSSSGAGPGAGAGSSPSGSAPSGSAPSGSVPSGAVPSGSPALPPPTGDYLVTYGFAVPSTPVTVTHTVNFPPEPVLVGIYAGDHPEGAPQYQRISFYFLLGFPSYTFQYVSSVDSDAQGAPIPLSGNAFMRIVFTRAVAHDDEGHSRVTASPPANIGYHNLRSYGPAGDFESHVTYGLGLQTAAGSDQMLKIRTGELKKPNGEGSFYYVVHFDVQTA
jgi:hypothetical protein